MKQLYNQNRFLLIIGMHRSGTSCLAGSLEECGLFLGDVNHKAAFNKKGNRENQRIVELHETILKNSALSWFNPPHGLNVVDWSEDARMEQKSIFKSLLSRSNGKMFGIKDPRTLLLLNGWAFYDPVFLATYRHPLAVAESIVSRAKVWKDNFSREQALDIWCCYNERLLAQFAKTPFPTIRYDQKIDDYIHQVKLFSEMSFLDYPERAGVFRTSELTHFDETQQAVPQKCINIWNRLEKLPSPSDYF